MALHRHLIQLDPSAIHKNYHYSPQINQVIKSTLDHQIKQHQTVSHSPERSLIARTKQLLQYEPTAMNKTSERWTFSGDSSRGATARLKSRRDGRLNETKRQLELLNQFYKSNNKTQIKRYQDEIQQEQSQIHTIVAQYRLKRKWNGKSNSQNKKMRESVPLSTPNPQKQIAGEKNTAAEPQFERSKKSDLEEFDMDVFFDRTHPYRRLLITRRKSKGKVEPWGATINL